MGSQKGESRKLALRERRTKGGRCSQQFAHWLIYYFIIGSFHNSRPPSVGAGAQGQEKSRESRIGGRGKGQRWWLLFRKRNSREQWLGIGVQSSYFGVIKLILIRRSFTNERGLIKKRIFFLFPENPQ